MTSGRPDCPGDMSLLARRRIDVLTPLLGRWRTTGEVLADDGSVESRFAGTDSYERLGNGFVLHRAEVERDGPRVGVCEVIGDYDAELDALPTWVFDGGTGSFEQSLMTLEADGALVFRSGHGPARAEADLRVADDGDRMTVEWRLTDDDGVTWAVWLRLVFERVDRPTPD